MVLPLLVLVWCRRLTTLTSMLAISSPIAQSQLRDRVQAGNAPETRRARLAALRRSATELCGIKSRLAGVFVVFVCDSSGKERANEGVCRAKDSARAGGLRSPVRRVLRHFLAVLLRSKGLPSSGVSEDESAVGRQATAQQGGLGDYSIFQRSLCLDNDPHSSLSIVDTGLTDGNEASSAVHCPRAVSCAVQHNVWQVGQSITTSFKPARRN